MAGGGVAGVEFVRVDSGILRLMVFKLMVFNNVTNKNR